MPDKETLFPQAENQKFNVSNVLNDGSGARVDKQPETPDENPDINIEEGAPFTDGIDPEAKISDYVRLNEEEDLQEEQAPQEPAEEAPPQPAAPSASAKRETLQSAVIRKQAQRARASFLQDLRSLDDEPAIQRLNQVDHTDDEEDPVAAVDQAIEEKVAAEPEDAEETPDEAPVEAPEPEDTDEDEPEQLTFKDLLAPASRLVKKPRFSQKHEDDAEAEEETEEKPAAEAFADDAPRDDIDDEETAISDDIMKEKVDAQEETEEEYYEDELAEARAAQQKGHSICDDLYQLQSILEEAKSPMFHKTEVLVPREKTLRLVRSLTAICEVDPSYIDGGAEDKLVDRLVSEHSDEDYEPLKRARNRAQSIIKNATDHADTIVNDAKILATQLLTETEAEIKEKYDAADDRISLRMTTAKEESSKKLNQAREELTISRQRSVEILSKYLEKAEDDYQGYWERAENTVVASLEQSESILKKAEEIYQRELDAIRQDRDELDEILEHLKRYKKF
ncbi:MAG: hypothetical protein Q4C56_03545 [Peptococcaceae bacterium]|nr:hypothetical protein [Peptococcaceae bacterium]